MSKKIENNPGGLYIILGGVVLGVGGYFLYKAIKGSQAASSSTSTSNGTTTSNSITSTETTSSTGFTAKKVLASKPQTVNLSQVKTVESALDDYLKYFSDMAVYAGTTCLKSYSAFTDAYSKVVAAEKGGTLTGAGLLAYAKQWNDYAYAIYQSECGDAVTYTSSPKN